MSQAHLPSKLASSASYRHLHLGTVTVLCGLLSFIALCHASGYAATKLSKPDAKKQEAILALQAALPFLTGWRDEHGVFFGFRRLETAPIHYGLLHLFPAWVLFIDFR
ncbi:hypothetical protein ACQY0O_003362 [Thecaphora frezii]